MPDVTLTANLVLTGVSFAAGTGVTVRYSIAIGGTTIHRSLNTTFPPALQQQVIIRAIQLAVADAKNI
jgi:hypothetical protein